MATAKKKAKAKVDPALKAENERHSAIPSGQLGLEEASLPPDEDEPVVVEQGPWSQQFEGEPLVEEGEASYNENKQAEAAPPRNYLTEYENAMNGITRELGPHIPLPLIVGFLELKLIEFKESYRLETERNIRMAMGAQLHGNA